MLSVIAKDIHVEFPIYDLQARSLRHTLGLKHLAKGIDRFAPGKLDVGGRIGAAATRAQ